MLVKPLSREICPPSTDLLACYLKQMLVEAAGWRKEISITSCSNDEPGLSFFATYLLGWRRSATIHQTTLEGR